MKKKLEKSCWQMMSFDEIKKYSSNIAEAKSQCKKCGRKEIITRNQEKALCTHCGYYIFRSDLDEFKYRMKEELRK